MLIHNPLSAALNETVLAVNALLLGAGTSTATPAGTFVFKAAFVALVVAGVLVLTWSSAQHRAATIGARGRTDDVGQGIDLLILAALYVACMFYAGVTTSISYGSARNLVPIAGLLFLLFGWGVALAPRSTTGSPRLERIALVLLGTSLLPYAYLNALVSLRHPVDASAAVTAQMDELVDGKKTIREAIAELVGPDGVIMANNGQAVGHVLGAKTVSLIGPAFSTTVWDEVSVESAIRRFNVQAVVITLPAPGRPADEAIASAFVRQLAQGAAPPWLTLAFRSAGVLVYVPHLPAR
jgi:hypothetical protein